MSRIKAHMDDDAAREIVATVPLLGMVDRVESLDKGLSTDKKFILWQDDEPQYLLRLSDIEAESQQDENRYIFDLRMRGCNG